MRKGHKVTTLSCKRSFKLDIREVFFTVSVMKHWKKLPREAVGSPCLEVFKTRMDGALNNLV